MNKKSILNIALVCLLSSGSFAYSQDYSGSSIENRLGLIEKDLRILNKEVYKNGVSPLSGNAQKADIETNKKIADFEIRLSSLEDSIRKTNGSIEEINHNNEILDNKISKIQSDIEYRINSLEEKITILENKSSEKIDLTPIKETSSSMSRVVVTDENLSVEEQYRKAFNYLKDKDYKKAEKAFSDFIEGHPENKLAGNAQYWLAETYYVRGNMEEAMKQFAIGYKNYKNSDKAKDNLLKLAITLGSLDRKKDACLTLKELVDKYSPLPTNIASRASNEKTKNNCSD